MAKCIVRMREAVNITGLSQSTIWAKIKAKEFPQPIRLTERSIGFDADELDAFIERRRAEPYRPSDMRQQVEAKAASRSARRVNVGAA